MSKQPLTHATMNGLAVLRGERTTHAHSWLRACEPFFDMTHSIDCDSLRHIIPTCERCAVLRDAALEGE